MPWGVRNCPDNRQPRSFAFARAGFEWGSIPPKFWRMYTSGATPPFVFLNDGAVCEAVTEDTNDNRWEEEEHSIPLTRAVVTVKGVEPWQGPPLPFTIDFSPSVEIAGEVVAVAAQQYTYPTAVQTWGPFTMLTPESQPIPELPNPVFVDPFNPDYP